MWVELTRIFSPLQETEDRHKDEDGDQARDSDYSDYYGLAGIGSVDVDRHPHHGPPYTLAGEPFTERSTDVIEDVHYAAQAALVASTLNS